MKFKLQKLSEADGKPSQLIIVGIERRADGVLMIHSPTKENRFPEIKEAKDPVELWITIRDLLNNPELPRVTTEKAGEISLEQALAELAGEVFTNFIVRKSPAMGPVAKKVIQTAAKKADGVFEKIRKPDLPFKYYVKTK